MNSERSTGTFQMVQAVESLLKFSVTSVEDTSDEAWARCSVFFQVQGC